MSCCQPGSVSWEDTVRLQELLQDIGYQDAFSFINNIFISLPTVTEQKEILEKLQLVEEASDKLEVLVCAVKEYSCESSFVTQGLWMQHTTLLRVLYDCYNTLKEKLGSDADAIISKTSAAPKIMRTFGHL